MGHRVLVIAPTFPGDDAHNGKEQDLLRVPAIQNFNGSDFSVRIVLPFIVDRKIDAFQPDVIHSHHPYLLGDAAIRIARRRNLPLLFTHHTLYEKYTHYVPLDSKILKSFVIHLSTAYANLCTRVIAPSQSLARLIRKRGVTTPISEIPTGVDTEFLSKGRGTRFRQSHGISEEVLVIGHLGRLAPEKNLDYLAEAIALCLDDNRKAVFLVAGSGPSEVSLREIFEARGLGDRLILAGTVTGETLRDAYKAMDVFVFASKTETQGLVLAEAMAAGNPVVALNASGTREVVRDGQNGRLLPAHAPPRVFAESVSEVAESRRRTDRWGKEAKNTARQFSREVCARKMHALYDSVCGRPELDKKQPDEFATWNVLLRRIQTEWNLFSQKTTAAVGAVKTEEESLEKME
jgi:glycosyltransferase involved in cell wall biosynthesis